MSKATFRFGYVSHALSLYDASPAKTLTYARYHALSDNDKHARLVQVAKENLSHTIRMLHYNIAHEVPIYRFSSSLIPLATHPDVLWDFEADLGPLFQTIGQLVRDHQLSVSFHPGQFTLFTSDKPHITEQAVIDMRYHHKMLELMGIDQTGLINLHVGGKYGDAKQAIERFFENINALPSPILNRLTLENDDRSYTTDETLAICERLGVPMVFDYHHEKANPSPEPLEALLPRIFKTWSHTGRRPKIHLSSPKSDDAYRSHADYVSFDFIKPLLKLVQLTGTSVDFMIEAKQKDRALFQLVDDISRMRGWKRQRTATIEVP